MNTLDYENLGAPCWARHRLARKLHQQAMTWAEVGLAMTPKPVSRSAARALVLHYEHAMRCLVIKREQEKRERATDADRTPEGGR